MERCTTPEGGLTVQETPKRNVASRVFRFYYDGFRNMNRTWRIVWLVVLVKLFIMFAILKVFFFPDYLGTKCDSDEQRSEYVLQELTGGQ